MTKKLRFRAKNIDSGVEVEFVRVPGGTTRESDDQYRAYWRYGQMQHSQFYDIDVVERQLTSGPLQLMEIIEEEKEQMNKLPDTFNFRYKNVLHPVYRAEKNQEGFTVTFTDAEGVFQSLGYPLINVETNVKQGVWNILDDAAAPLEPCDELISAPYTFEALEEGWFVNIISDDGDDEISSKELRAFAKELGAIVEIDEDFYVINLRGVKFTAVDVPSLRRIMESITVLDAAANE